MQHTITPFSSELPPFYWWKDAFSIEELNYLQGRARAATEKPLVGDGVQNTKLRRCNISWINKNEETNFVFEKLAYVASQINKFYRFDLIGFGEALQLTTYSEDEQGTYGWHQDFGSDFVSRKLSIVVQLSDPHEYEGGNLQILNGENPVTIEKQRGLIAVFPSYTLHRVTPVTKGNRQSLVAWVTGPMFR